MAVHAHFEQSDRETDRRSSTRRVLKLETVSAKANQDVLVLIHDLSATGLLIETAAHLELGTEFEVNLPEAGSARATVVWNQGQFFGCMLLTPLSRGSLSAALLRSAPPVPADLPSEEFTGASERRAKLPLGARLLIILGLSLGAWAIVLALLVI